MSADPRCPVVVGVAQVLQRVDDPRDGREPLDMMIEACTVPFHGETAQAAYAGCLLDDGRRSWAQCSDGETMSAMMREEFCGRRIEIDGAGGFRVL